MEQQKTERGALALQARPGCPPRPCTETPDPAAGAQAARHMERAGPCRPPPGHSTCAPDTILSPPSSRPRLSSRPHTSGHPGPPSREPLHSDTLCGEGAEDEPRPQEEPGRVRKRGVLTFSSLSATDAAHPACPLPPRPRNTSQVPECCRWCLTRCLPRPPGRPPGGPSSLASRLPHPCSQGSSTFAPRTVRSRVLALETHSRSRGLVSCLHRAEVPPPQFSNTHSFASRPDTSRTTLTGTPPLLSTYLPKLVALLDTRKCMS